MTLHRIQNLPPKAKMRLTLSIVIAVAVMLILLAIFSGLPKPPQADQDSLGQEVGATIDQLPKR